MPTVFITGANRGLGFEFVRQYLAEGWEVFAACRSPGAAAALNSLAMANHKLHLLALDVSSAADIRRVGADFASQAIDVLINNAGIFGPKRGADGDLGQTFGHIDENVCMSLFQVNALAPLLIAQAFLPAVLAGEQKKVITITSTLGSVAATEGGIYAYRMSKAAVNMAMATLAVDLADRGVLLGIINPGWVKTDMGGIQASLSPDASIRSMRRVIEELGAAQSGKFQDYNGGKLAW